MVDTGQEAIPAGSAPPKAKLDDLMMAMDVVDTLRHQETLIERELGQETRDAELKERLRRIYESQGLDVNDRILDEGIKALKESRFSYERRGSGIARFFAMLWVRRALAAALALAAVVLCAALLGSWWWQAQTSRREAEAARIEITETLPREIASAAGAARNEAQDPQARQAIDQLEADGRNAVQRADPVAARKAVTDLKALRERLFSTYDLVVVQDGQSGVFRIPDVNSATRNYYLIVEAVAPDGSKLTLPVTNEETGAREQASTWGVRVPEETYSAIRRDKEDDGIISDRILGTKPKGALEPSYRKPVLGGAITKW